MAGWPGRFARSVVFSLSGYVAALHCQAGSALHRVNALPRRRPYKSEAMPHSLSQTGKPPVSLFTRASLSPRLVSPTTMASADFCLITRRIAATGAARPKAGRPVRQISPGKNAVLRHTTASFTSRDETNGFAVLCQLTCPDRPPMRFLFVGSWLSHSLYPFGLCGVASPFFVRFSRQAVSRRSVALPPLASASASLFHRFSQQGT